MGLSVGGNWWDQLGTSIGDSLIGMADPFGSLNPADPMARQNAIRSSVGVMGAGMLANSRKRPMEAFGSAFQGAQQQGQQNSMNMLNAQNLMLGMENQRKDMAWEGTERQNALEDRDAEEDRKKQMAEYVQQQLANPDIPQNNKANAMFFMAAGDYEKAYQALTGEAGQSEAGLNLTYWKDEQGKLHAGQTLKGGGIKEVPLPEGSNWAPGVGFIDTATGYMPYDKRGGIQEGAVEVPKNLRGAEKEKELGSMEGRQTAAAPGDVAAADMALGLINDLKNDKRRGAGTGWSAIVGAIPGTDAQAYQAKVNQAAAGSFLTAIQQMRGLGQLSNQEGLKVESALQRMTANIYNEEAFLEALEEYEDVVRAARDRAGGRIGASPLPDTADEGGWTTLPNGVRIRQKGP